MSRLDRPEWCPRLRKGHRFAPAEEGSWQVRWNFDEVAFLDGKEWNSVLPWLVPRLDGCSSLGELQAVARDRGMSAELSAVIEQLEVHGFLADDTESAACDSASESLNAALESLGRHPADVLKNVYKNPVIVYGRSELAECLVRSVSRHGFAVTACSEWDGQFVSSNEEGCLPVVVETDSQPNELEDMNERALAERRPWMLVAAWNARVLVGPIFLPGETACYACYRHRLHSHRQYQAEFDKFDAWHRSETSPSAPEPVLPGLSDLAAASVALELFAHVSGVSVPRTLGRVLVYQPQNGQLGNETVLRIPWCPQCSSARV